MTKSLIATGTLFLSGLIAGTFFYGTLCVLPAFFDVPYHVHITFRTTLMNYNRYTVMALVIMALVGNLIYLWQIRKNKTAKIWCVISLILIVGILLITRLGSVPINMEMKTWNTTIPPSDYQSKIQTWNLYNNVRTIAALLSFFCLLVIPKCDNKSKSVDGRARYRS